MIEYDIYKWVCTIGLQIRFEFIVNQKRGAAFE